MFDSNSDLKIQLIVFGFGFCFAEQIPITFLLHSSFLNDSLSSIVLIDKYFCYLDCMKRIKCNPRKDIESKRLMYKDHKVLL